MVGKNKELSKVSVLALETNLPDSPINYVLMVVDNIGGASINEIEFTETELFINKLFVQGEYKQYADKFQINRDDLKRIFFEASEFLCKNKIPCTIAIILKPVKEFRDIFISRTGTGSSYIINSQFVQVLNDSGDLGDATSQPGLLEKPQLYAGKISKEDTILLCTESLSAVLDRNFIQRTILSSKGPEEASKKLLHSASMKGKKENISIAAFNGKEISRHPNKERISNKTLLLITIPLFLILIGLVIFRLSSGTKEISQGATLPAPINTFDSSGLPRVVEKRNTIPPAARDSKIPIVINTIKKSSEHIKKIEVNFIVNGSVVMISNWESIRQDIFAISWGNGITDNKRIHKYPDYTSIPSSVRVTYKDHSARTFRIK